MRMTSNGVSLKSLLLPELRSIHSIHGIFRSGYTWYNLLTYLLAFHLPLKMLIIDFKIGRSCEDHDIHRCWVNIDPHLAHT